MTDYEVNQERDLDHWSTREEDIERERAWEEMEDMYPRHDY